MIRECRIHGFFRAEQCPSCGAEGLFILNDYEQEQVSKLMATMLRHMPSQFGITVDKNGWADIMDIVRSIDNKKRDFKWLRPKHIIALVSTDPKERFEIRDNLVRATYGHSMDLDLDLPTDNIPTKLYYPTTEDEVEILIEAGIKPTDRKKVHLSGTTEQALNAGYVRSNNPIIVEIDAENAIKDGYVIKRANKYIYLCDEVDPKYIKRIDTEKLKESLNSEGESKESNDTDFSE